MEDGIKYIKALVAATAVILAGVFLQQLVALLAPGGADVPEIIASGSLFLILAVVVSLAVLALPFLQKGD